MATAIEPGALLEVLANIDLGTKRWRRKAQIVGVLGRWGDGHQVGMREIHRRTGISNSLLEELLAELVAGSVLVVVEMGTGTRATTWAVSASIDRWRGVPWLKSVDAVERWAFHVEHERNAEPAQRSAYRPRSERKPKQRSEGGPHAERKISQRSEGGPYTERNENRAFRRGGVGGALAATEPEKGFVTISSNNQGSSSLRAGGAEEADSAEFRGLRDLVRKAAGAAYVKGKPETALRELMEEHGAELVRSWVLEAPPRLGVPSLVSWLCDRPYAPSPEEMAALDARKEIEPPPKPDDGPARPVLRPVDELVPATVTATPEERAQVLAEMRAARSAMNRPEPLPDGTMEPTEVTQ